MNTINVTVHYDLQTLIVINMHVPCYSETSHLLPIYTLVVPVTVLSLGTYIIHGMSNAAVQRQYQLNTIQLQDTEHVSFS